MNAVAPLYITGLGPGNVKFMAPAAIAALENAECIAGYGPYLDLLPQSLKTGKSIIESGMRHEKERCEKAIEAAFEGHPAALVCSGDPGIYAMASLALEIMERKKILREARVEIIPGIPALCAAAARMGAPLGHDFACISLSDLLTPWEIIEKRVNCALEGDFVCVLYNPRSRNRPDYLRKTMELAKKHRGSHCPVGIGKNVARPGEKIVLSRIGEFDCELADMLSIVIIGNSQTRLADNYMLTPRGYFAKM